MYFCFEVLPEDVKEEGLPQLPVSRKITGTWDPQWKVCQDVHKKGSFTKRRVSQGESFSEDLFA
jgi:hypothetical protein